MAWGCRTTAGGSCSLGCALRTPGKFAYFGNFFDRARAGFRDVRKIYSSESCDVVCFAFFYVR